LFVVTVTVVAATEPTFTVEVVVTVEVACVAALPNVKTTDDFVVCDNPVTSNPTQPTAFLAAKLVGIVPDSVVTAELTVESEVSTVATVVSPEYA